MAKSARNLRAFSFSIIYLRRQIYFREKREGRTPCTLIQNPSFSSCQEFSGHSADCSLKAQFGLLIVYLFGLLPELSLDKEDEVNEPSVVAPPNLDSV